MSRYLLFTLLFLFHCLNGSAQEVMVQREHVYPYSQKKLWGLCNKERKVLTPARYDKMMQKAQFVLCHIPATEYWDIYTAQGLFLANTPSIFLLSDTSFLTFGFQGYSSGDKVAGFRHEVVYDSRGQKEARLTGELTSSSEFEDYVNAAESQTAMLCYASGRKITLPFKVLQYAGTHDKFIIRADGKEGVYDGIRNQLVIPPRWRNIGFYAYHPIVVCTDTDNRKRLIGLDGSDQGPLPAYLVKEKSSNTYVKPYIPGNDLSLELKTVSGGQAILHTRKCERTYYSANTSIPSKPLLWQGLNCFYLTGPDQRSLLPVKDNPDSLLYDIGNGLIAIQRFRTFKDEQGISRKSADRYVSAIYDTKRRTIIARGDDETCRIRLDGSSYVVYTMETTKQIIYIGPQYDTVAVLKKALPDFNDIPKYNAYGFLEIYQQGCKIYNADGSQLVFDRYSCRLSDNNAYYFQFKKDGKWGIFTIPVDTAVNKINPKTVQATIRIPAKYDAIRFDNIDRNPVYTLFKNGVTYTDTSWQPLPDSLVTFVEQESLRFNNGNKLVFCKEVAYPSRAETGYRIFVRDRNNAILYQRRFPKAPKEPKDHYGSIIDYAFDIVNDHTIIYHDRSEGNFSTIDIRHNKDSVVWSSKYVNASFLHLNNQVVAIQSSQKGLSLTLPTSSPLDLLTIPSAGPHRIETTDIPITARKRQSIFLLNPAAQLIFNWSKEPFFDDCLYLEDKDGNFAGVASIEGGVYN